jgi:hypothetical protein
VRKAHRARLPTRPLSQSQITRDESLKRQTWGQYRSWSRITSGVLLSVIGAVQYGTSKVFYKVVPHFDTEGLRQYIHQVMALFGHTGKEVVMVADRSGIHRAKKLASTLAHWQKQFRLHLLPTHCGHHLNDLTGTLFDRSKRSLAPWLLATFLLCLSCSSCRIARELGGHIRTGYRWCW